MSNISFRNLQNDDRAVCYKAGRNIFPANKVTDPIISSTNNPLKRRSRFYSFDSALRRFPSNKWNTRRCTLQCNQIKQGPRYWHQVVKGTQNQENVESLIQKVKESKKRAKQSRQKLIKTINRVQFQCDLKKMKVRLEHYNKKKQVKYNTKQQKSFDEFWRSFSILCTLFDEFDQHTQNEILSKWMKQYYKQCDIWSLFTELEISEIFQEMNFEIKLYSAGQTLFSKGKKGRYFYTILAGNVSIWTNNKTNHKWEKIKILERTSVFGELALFPSGITKRNATCITDSKCLLMLINKQNYLKYLHDKIMKSRKKPAEI